MFELVARVATNWITMFKFTLKMMYEHTFFYLIKVNGVWRIIDSAREKNDSGTRQRPLKIVLAHSVAETIQFGSPRMVQGAR